MAPAPAETAQQEGGRGLAVEEVVEVEVEGLRVLEREAEGTMEEVKEDSKAGYAVAGRAE